MLNEEARVAERFREEAATTSELDSVERAGAAAGRVVATRASIDAVRTAVLHVLGRCGEAVRAAERSASLATPGPSADLARRVLEACTHHGGDAR